MLVNNINNSNNFGTSVPFRRTNVTNATRAGIARYFNSREVHSTLSLKEQAELASEIKNGNQAARDTLMMSGRSVVNSVAKRFKNPRVPKKDILQYGALGLAEAANRYDPARGTEFNTYATWWVRGTITRALQDTAHLIRIPVHTQEEISKLYSAEKHLTNKLGRFPNTDEIAEKMGVKAEEVEDLQLVEKLNPLSLDAPLGKDDGDAFLGDFVPAEVPQIDDALTPSEEATAIKKIREGIKILPQREQAILDSRFGLSGKEPKTLKEASEEFKLSRERVRVLQDRALLKLREKFPELSDYL